jgi:hypothetical protein
MWQVDDMRLREPAELSHDEIVAHPRNAGVM